MYTRKHEELLHTGPADCLVYSTENCGTNSNQRSSSCIPSNTLLLTTFTGASPPNGNLLSGFCAGGGVC